VGTKSVKTTTEVKYIKGDTIRISDTVTPEPVKMIIPVDTHGLLSYCKRSGMYKEYFSSDSVLKVVVDTVKVVEDWSSKVLYDIELFNIDTVGLCSLSTYVQYNRLGPLDTKFIPINKVTETQVIKSRSVYPFVGIGLNTDGYAIGTAGVFINNSFGLSGQIQVNSESKNFGVILHKIF
jgi:hypothetical protein